MKAILTVLILLISHRVWSQSISVKVTADAFRVDQLIFNSMKINKSDLLDVSNSIVGLRNLDNCSSI